MNVPGCIERKFCTTWAAVSTPAVSLKLSSSASESSTSSKVRLPCSVATKTARSCFFSTSITSARIPCAAGDVKGGRFVADEIGIGIGIEIHEIRPDTDSHPGIPTAAPRHHFSSVSST